MHRGYAKVSAAWRPWNPRAKETARRVRVAVPVCCGTVRRRVTGSYVYEHGNGEVSVRVSNGRCYRGEPVSYIASYT